MNHVMYFYHLSQATIIIYKKTINNIDMNMNNTTTVFRRKIDKMNI